MHHQGFDLATAPEKAKAHAPSRLRAKDRPLANDFVTDEDFDQMLDAWFGNMARVLEAGRGFYIWGGYANLGNYPPFLKKNGLYFTQGIVWDKQHPVLTRKDFMGAFEIAFYGWKEGAAHKFYGPNNATDLWHVKKVNPQSMVHLTEKPVELAVRAMQYQQSRRRERAGPVRRQRQHADRRRADRAPGVPDGTGQPYCDVIVQRWEKFTGKKAERITAAGAAGTDMPEKTPAEVAGVGGVA